MKDIEEKVMTQEEKAKRFDEVLAMAKECITHVPDNAVNQYLLDMFPELKESEDEKIISAIRKAIEAKVENLGNGVTRTACLAWLKKQEKHLKNYDEAEKEKDDFVSGNFIYCHKSFDEFKEGVSYWLEYIGDDIYIGRSDNILNKKFHIIPRQLFNLFSLQHNEEQYGKQADDAPLEDSSNLDINDSNVFVPMSYGKEIDEAMYEACRRYELPHTDADKYSLADVFYAGVCASENKKPEWSDEDKNFMHDTLGNLTELKDRYGEGYGNVGKCIEWLKSLKLQLKNEWSKEDERIRNTALSFLYEFKRKGYENAVECIEWLKSLKQREQPQSKTTVEAE